MQELEYLKAVQSHMLLHLVSPPSAFPLLDHQRDPVTTKGLMPMPHFIVNEGLLWPSERLQGQIHHLEQRQFWNRSWMVRILIRRISMLCLTGMPRSPQSRAKIASF